MLHTQVHLGLRVGITAVASVPQRRPRGHIVQMRPSRLDLSLDSLGVTQQQIALLTRRHVPKLPVGLVGAHVLDPDAHRAQARQRLQPIEVLLAVAAMPLLASRSTGPISATSS